jgi:hypothetical protein
MSTSASTSADVDDVEVMGEKTRTERDAELQRDAISLDDNSEWWRMPRSRKLCRV